MNETWTTRAHSLRIRADVGRRDAIAQLEELRPRSRVAIYLTSDDHPAAVAYWRLMGRAGWGNRSARRRGILGGIPDTLMASVAGLSTGTFVVETRERRAGTGRFAS